MKRRAVIGLCLLLAGAALFAGGADEVAARPTEIEFWTTETQSERMATIELLVDTYDTMEGVRKVIELSKTMGPDFSVRAVRIDADEEVVVEPRPEKVAVLDGEKVPPLEAMTIGAVGVMSVTTWRSEKRSCVEPLSRRTDPGAKSAKRSRK